MPRDLTARPVEPTAVDGSLAPAAARLARLLEDLPLRVLPERVAPLRGRVLVRAHEGDERPDPVTLVLDGVLRVQPGTDPGADVVLHCEVTALESLVGGVTSAGLLLLGGRLEVSGDLDLALGLAGCFRSATDPRVAVDPVALDPVEVSRVLAAVPGEHLAAVMASPLRATVLEEIFRQLPLRLDLRRARGARLVVGFRLLGHPDGEIERYEVRVADGVATVARGDQAGERDATITLQAHDLLRLATGHLRPVTGVLRGQLKVRGDRGHALKLASLIDIPHA